MFGQDLLSDLFYLALYRWSYEDIIPKMPTFQLLLRTLLLNFKRSTEPDTDMQNESMNFI